jgi:putative hemolysin
MAAWPDLRPGTEIGEKLLTATPLYPVGRIAEKLLSIDRLDTVYTEARRGGREFFPNLLDRLDIGYTCPDHELARIPLDGPAIVVSNHPFGLAEAPVLASLLLQKRKDLRILANSLLASINLLKDYLIAVDVFGGKDAGKSNFRGLRAAIEWLQGGGMLLVFPAGEVSSFQFPQLRVVDSRWNDSIGRIARITASTIVPVYIHGTNGSGFQMAGMIHPLLRTALLPRELFNKRGHKIRVSVGIPIAKGAHPAYQAVN